MIKRLGMSLIWFYAGWYAGAMAAFFVGFDPRFGPVFGVVAAALYMGDTRRLWQVRRPADATTSPLASTLIHTAD